MTNGKILLAGVLQNPPTRLTSHNAGWTYVVKSMAEQRYRKTVEIAKGGEHWSDFDRVVLTEGVNFRAGTWNLFGGVSEALKARVRTFRWAKDSCLFVDTIDQCPDYKDLALKRNLEPFALDGKIDSETTWNFIPAAKTFVLGDSHSISVYEPGANIRRIDGKTLYGALKIGLENLVPLRENPYEKLVLYFGNIDLRFHIYDGISGIDTLLKHLFWQTEALLVLGHCKSVKLVMPLPIETEDRKIPKSGQYKGRNFLGSAENRKMFRRYWVNKCESIFKKLIKSGEVHLEKWNHLKLDDEGFLLQNQMEAKQSVHLAPHSYSAMFTNYITNGNY